MTASITGASPVRIPCNVCRGRWLSGSYSCHASPAFSADSSCSSVISIVHKCISNPTAASVGALAFSPPHVDRPSNTIVDNALLIKPRYLFVSYFPAQNTNNVKLARKLCLTLQKKKNSKSFDMRSNQN